MIIRQTIGTYRYFCCTCGGLFRGNEPAYPYGEKPNQGEPLKDRRLICGSCGADHLVRQFYGSDSPSELRVRREQERIAISLQHLVWHAKHQAERAVEALQTFSGAMQQSKADDYLRYVQNWQHTPRRHIDLLPVKQSMRVATKLLENVACYSLLIVFAPFLIVIEVCEKIKSVHDSRPSVLLRKEQENQKRIAYLREVRIVRLSAIEENYRMVGPIRLPGEQRTVKRGFYLGYELDNPLIVADPFEEALKKLSCAECGELGSLTDRFLPGMICPCCKSDTLEESPEARAQRGTLWL